MSTQPLDLKMSDEELNAFDLRDECDPMYGVSGEQLRPVAELATAKAAWELVNWLRQDKWGHIRKQDTYGYMMDALEEILEAQGIERPEGE